MPIYCEICSIQDGRAVFWMDATQPITALAAYSPIEDDVMPPLSTFQVCQACQDRFTSGQWAASFTPNTLVVHSSTGSAPIVH